MTDFDFDDDEPRLSRDRYDRESQLTQKVIQSYFTELDELIQTDSDDEWQDEPEAEELDLDAMWEWYCNSDNLNR